MTQSQFITGNLVREPFTIKKISRPVDGPRLSSVSSGSGRGARARDKEMYTGEIKVIQPSFI